MNYRGSTMIVEVDDIVQGSDGNLYVIRDVAVSTVRAVEIYRGNTKYLCEGQFTFYSTMAALPHKLRERGMRQLPSWFVEEISAKAEHPKVHKPSPFAPAPAPAPAPAAGGTPSVESAEASLVVAMEQLKVAREAEEAAAAKAQEQAALEARLDAIAADRELERAAIELLDKIEGILRGHAKATVFATVRVSQHKDGLEDLAESHGFKFVQVGEETLLTPL